MLCSVVHVHRRHRPNSSLRTALFADLFLDQRYYLVDRLCIHVNDKVIEIPEYVVQRAHRIADLRGNLTGCKCLKPLGFNDLRSCVDRHLLNFFTTVVAAPAHTLCPMNLWLT